MTKKRQPSKTPHTKSWPPPRERGTPHHTGGSSRKSHPSKPNWLQRFIRAFFVRNKMPEIIPTDRPPPPDPRITPTTVHGNYPSTQEQLEKEYDKYLSEERDKE